MSSPLRALPELRVNTVCPYCMTTSPVASNVTGTEQPTDGMLTICAECAGVSVFDFSKPGGRRHMTKTERDDIDRNPDMVYRISIAQRYIISTRRGLADQPTPDLSPTKGPLR